MIIDYNKYLGKKVYIETIKNWKYEGEIISVDDSNPNGLVWIELFDSLKKKWVIILNHEIAKLEVKE